MTKEIERSGIPVVHVNNLTKISEGIGARRILRGNSVLHVFGNPSLTAAGEIAYRKELVEQAINMLEKEPENGEYSLIEE